MSLSRSSTSANHRDSGGTPSRPHDRRNCELVKSLIGSHDLQWRDSRFRRCDLWFCRREHEVSGSRRPSPVCRPCCNDNRYQTKIAPTVTTSLTGDAGNSSLI
ncbi:hypothetical protein TIFTF001_018699 [Ficus carica]|uniref:Uncharacterized protein n=1 Tax=Ficus carica TaxID=3494 RepID=A0AA88DAZ9_FICCA|nr:hypothetical protein TIFTF001_018699 [Ficus carica]